MNMLLIIYLLNRLSSMILNTTRPLPFRSGLVVLLQRGERTASPLFGLSTGSLISRYLEDAGSPVIDGVLVSDGWNVFGRLPHIVTTRIEFCCGIVTPAGSAEERQGEAQVRACSLGNDGDTTEMRAAFLHYRVS